MQKGLTGIKPKRPYIETWPYEANTPIHQGPNPRIKGSLVLMGALLPIQIVIGIIFYLFFS
jgi:hypothetical protein